MTRHTVVVYTVTVTEFGNPGAYRDLGDVDKAGTKLPAAVHAAWTKVHEQLDPDADISIEHHCDLPNLTDLQTGAVLLRGEKGVRSGLELDGGHAERHLHNVETVRVAGLVDIPSATHKIGYLGIYVPQARGVSTPTRVALSELFRAKHADLMLRIDPFVPRSLLQRAIDQHGIAEVEYIAWKKPEDRFPDATEWVDPDSLGKVRTIVSALRGRHLGTDKIQKWLDADSDKQALLVFQEKQYDECKVTVDVDGRRVKIHLGDTNQGRAASAEVQPPATDDDGLPTPEGLKAAILEGINSVTATA